MALMIAQVINRAFEEALDIEKFNVHCEIGGSNERNESFQMTNQPKFGHTFDGPNVIDESDRLNEPPASPVNLISIVLCLLCSLRIRC